MSYVCNLLCSLLPCDALESWLFDTLERFERILKYAGPVLAVLAAALVLIDAQVFFTTVVAEVDRKHGHAAAALHASVGVFLLYNVMFNHVLCATTSPGTTLETDPQELRLAMTNVWRWCSVCERGKPPLAHHCSICRRCVYKMDHHCVWMANCVGYQNYRFFFLYLWWMWVGSAYSVVMIYLYALRQATSFNTWVDNHFLAFLSIILSLSVFIALGGLLGWHTWLVVTGQGTIDAMAVQARAANGQAYSNPYNLGPLGNFQETFDAHGKLWWLTWMMPSRRQKKGLGYKLPKRTRAEALASAGSV